MVDNGMAPCILLNTVMMSTCINYSDVYYSYTY